MQSSKFIRKIRNYSLISCLLPLVTINLCLFVFQFLGSNDLYLNYNWSENKVYSAKEHITILEARQFSFTNCPKNKYRYNYITSDGKILAYADKQKLLETHSLIENVETFEKLKIESITFEYDETINNRCVKNSKFMYFFLNTFSPVEKILVDAKRKQTSGFGIVKNPYLYGEVSISRTARYFPATLIFKPLIILSAIFLFLYWINNISLFREFESKNILKNFSKKFFYLGVLSCIFLILHALFLGLDFDSKLLVKMRKVIIILFIFFEISAQIFLTRNLFKFKEDLKNYLNYSILKIKIAFVIIVFFVTCVIATLLILGDLSGTFKHVLEWNYFSVLLVYYLLSRLLWKIPQTHAHAP